MTESVITTPTGAYASFYPASVVLPDRTVLHRCKVFLTPQGVYVYRQAPVKASADVEPAFTAPIDFAAATRPLNDARMGYYLPVEGGTVTITGGGGCGCGSRLKYWVPEWARNTLPWPA
jgi:hypothetical protein